MKRFLCTFLALVMLFSCTTLLFSCKGDEDTTGSADNEVKKYDEDSLFYERSLVSDELEPRDFGGRKFRVVPLYPTEIFVEEEKRNQGDLMLDATFQIASTVENRFNTQLELAFTGDYIEVRDYVAKTILASSDEFDLVMGHVLETAGTVEKNLFLNWYDIEHIDFSKPWWFEASAEELTVNGKCMLAASHLNSTLVGGIYCLFFNKALAASYELPNLYDVVLQGDWTMDYFTELISEIYTDDGNDKRDAGDFYGLTIISTNPWFWAFDNPICRKNADGIPEITLNTDNADSMINKIYDLCYNTNGAYFDSRDQNERTEAKSVFMSGRALFMNSILSDVTGAAMRNFEDDYGILPLPKFDENQKDYCSTVGGYHTILAVPKTAKDTDFIGTIVEALSAEAWKIKTPTFYEIALKTRYLRDNESKEVLDLLVDTVKFDFGFISYFGFSNFVNEMMFADNNNFQSYFKKKKTHANYELKQIIKVYQRMN